MKKSKNIVVTGGNSGVGLETIRGLYEEGHNLIFGSRNQLNNENAAKDITQKQGGTLKHFKLDLSKRASIDEFVKNVKENFQVVDILINNAGLILEEKAISELGIEMTYTINHFGHFYLTYSLFDSLKKSDEARIINVSSSVHFSGEVSSLDDLACEKGYSGFGVYCNSKTFNVLFTVGLNNMLQAKNLKHIKTASLHPGIVETSFGGDSCLIKFFRCCFCCCVVDSADGAKTSLHLSRIPFEEIRSGQYYDDDTRHKEMQKDCRKSEYINKLWALSEKAYGIKFD